MSRVAGVSCSRAFPERYQSIPLFNEPRGTWLRGLATRRPYPAKSRVEDILAAPILLSAQLDDRPWPQRRSHQNPNPALLRRFPPNSKRIGKGRGSGL
jgi:hypothetical protein